MSFYIDVKLHSRQAIEPADVSLHRRMSTLAERALEAFNESEFGARPRGGMNELDRQIGQTSGYTTRLLSGEKKSPDPLILARIAELLRVRLDWLVTGGLPKRAVDLPAGAFLERVRELPGLEKWIGRHPKKYTVTQVATAVAIYDESPPRARGDGEPLTGWDGFISDALRAGPRPRRITGHQDAAEALETRQIPPAARARLPKRSSR